MDEAERQRMRREMAAELRIPLYRRYADADAAGILGVSLPTLKRMRHEGKIAYIRVSERKISFFGFQLLDYLLDSVTQPSCPSTKNENTKSETTGCPSARTAAHGTGCGSTPILDRHAALALAQRTFRKPSKS